MKDGEDISYYKYVQIGLELAAGVGLGFWAGYRLDQKLGSAPWLMLAGAAAGLGFATTTLGLGFGLASAAAPDAAGGGAVALVSAWSGGG